MTREQFIEEVAQLQESLRRFLCVLCAGDSSRADDIAQEALLKAYMSFGRFEGKAKFSTWLFRIAYNCFYDSRQKAGMGPIMESLPEETAEQRHGSDGVEQADADQYSGTTYSRDSRHAGAGAYSYNAPYHDAAAYADESERADKAFEHQQLYTAIEALSEQERTVVLLFYMEDKPINEIVQITGMPSGTVRSHLSRARAHLRRYLSSMR